MAEKDLNEAATAELAAGRMAHEKSMREFADRTKGKPTPTQEENDLAALGAHIVEHEEDGSNPDPHGQAGVTDKHMSGQHSANKPQTYSTRHTKAE